MQQLSQVLCIPKHWSKANREHLLPVHSCAVTAKLSNSWAQNVHSDYCSAEVQLLVITSLWRHIYDEETMCSSQTYVHSLLRSLAWLAETTNTARVCSGTSQDFYNDRQMTHAPTVNRMQIQVLYPLVSPCTQPSTNGLHLHHLGLPSC